MRTVRWTVTNAEPSEQIKDASWSADRRGKRSGFYIANYNDGVDREVKLEADPTNLRSYARIYGPALSFSHSGYGFDTMDDDAADCRITIADCRITNDKCRITIADCRLPIADCRLPIAEYRLPNWCKI